MIESSQALAIRALQGLFNRALALDPATRLSLGKLSDKRVRVVSTMPPFELTLAFNDRGDVTLTVPTSAEAEPPSQLSLQGTSLALATLALDRSDRVTLVGTGVRAEGDQDLLRQLKKILRNLDLDWEEALSILIGDVPSRMLAATLRSANRWRQQAGGRVSSGLAEYAREEIRLVPSRIEMDDFAAAVRYLSGDVDRIGARIGRLQRHLQETETR